MSSSYNGSTESTGCVKRERAIAGALLHCNAVLHCQTIEVVPGAHIYKLGFDLGSLDTNLVVSSVLGDKFVAF